jgi:hypothetical protein
MGESQGEYACSELYCPEGVLRRRRRYRKIPFFGSVAERFYHHLCRDYRTTSHWISLRHYVGL